ARVFDRERGANIREGSGSSQGGLGRFKHRAVQGGFAALHKRWNNCCKQDSGRDLKINRLLHAKRQASSSARQQHISSRQALGAPRMSCRSPVVTRPRESPA
ncbi:unnamed protein product, partial [Pylaiella littoralis]